ncbi:unnamed protein product [Alopecurus aequalis]
MTGEEAPAPACQKLSLQVCLAASPRGVFSPCSCPAAGGREAQGRWRRFGKEERLAGGGREQAVGGEVLPALHPLLAHALPRRRCPFQAVREVHGAGVLGSRIGINRACFPHPSVPRRKDSIRSLKDRYWVKANVWIIIFSYVGNYFWTHYFFTVLGASYTFPSWRMNNVPHTTFFLTHACFLFYHMASNMTLRRLRHSTAHLPQSVRWLFEGAWILALSYFIAYLETLAIANFPYYEFVDRDIMYTVGSMFYAIYFLVSFPMFSRIDEKAEKWDLCRVAVDALGAAMLVTIILDLWRIFLGPIVPIPESRQCGQPGLAWFQVQNESV